jgi:hypothetical protein
MTSHEFLEAVHGGTVEAGQHFVLWSPKTPTAFFNEIEPAAETARDWCDRGQDVYTGVYTLPEPLAQGRGLAEQAGGLVGLWADIDVAGPGHSEAHVLPPTRREAIRIVEALGPEPSLVVDSGGGLHVWWLFREPWIFADRDRIEARHLAARWNDTIRSVALQMGYHADATKSIVQVLRVAGTLNQKTSARPVTVIDSSAARYSAEDLEAFMIAEEFYPRDAAYGLQAVQVEAVTLTAGAGLPPVAFELIQSDSLFSKTFNRGRADLDDQSPSAYEMALASMAAGRGWTDQQIAETLLAWRVRHGEPTDKLLKRRDYITRTIGRARQHSLTSTALTEIRHEAIPAPGSMDPGKRQVCLDRLSKALGRKVLRFVKFQDERPTYSIVLGDPEQTIRLGPSAVVLRYAKMQEVWFEQGLILSKDLKKDWERISQLLLAVEEVCEDPETELEHRVRGYVTQYLETARPVDGSVMEQRAAAARERAPIEMNGRIYIGLTHLIGVAACIWHIALDAKKLRVDFKEFGFENSVIRAGKSTYRCYSIDKDRLAEPEGD